MFNKKKVFAIIPAKKYSKRLKNKNLKKIKNKTLLEIAINSAKKAKILITLSYRRILKIIEISSKLNCEVVKRPSRLCTEKALANDVIYHSIKKIIRIISYQIS